MVAVVVVAAFIAAATLEFLGQLDRVAWITGRQRVQYAMTALSEVAGWVVVLAFSHYAWWMVFPSVAGAVAGLWLAGRVTWPTATE